MQAERWGMRTHDGGRRLPSGEPDPRRAEAPHPSLIARLAEACDPLKRYREMPFDPQWSKNCPAMSLCRWVANYPNDHAQAFNDWSMYWTKDRLRRHRREVQSW
jgi:hypothetical protein